MVYLITGKNVNTVSFIANRLQEFLQTERRNWRHDVFHIDETSLNSLLNNDIEFISNLCNFIVSNGNDVVISIPIIKESERDRLKTLLNSLLTTIYVFSDKRRGKSDLIIDDYEEPISSHISVNTGDNIVKSFSYLIMMLSESKKL